MYYPKGALLHIHVRNVLGVTSAQWRRAVPVWRQLVIVGLCAYVPPLTIGYLVYCFRRARRKV